ncbi:MAG: efflux RND transporter periplasmic adaptor subunit [Deltaproteobacteria bacterium]|nr:efflux RND transporter periplasmic adaptor subunit [Deltaproteobacteria bacterium]
MQCLSAWRRWTPLVLIAVGLLACGEKEKDLAGAGSQGPVPVTALTVTARDVPVTFEYVAQTESSHIVQIRARVDGFLEKRAYTEGSMVRAGQVMFLMDRKPFEAALQQARGSLALANAQRTMVQANLARVRPLAAEDAVSQKDLDDAVGQAQMADAAVLAAEGKVREAELNLGYATITSPIAGLSSRALKQEGSYLSPGADSLLTTVARLDPIWVNFSISENEWLKRQEEVQEGRLILPPTDQFEVEAILADGSVFSRIGGIVFTEPAYSRETGTLLERVQFANPRMVLKPGQFVRVRLKGAVRPNAVLVPRRAVMQGTKGHFVWAVTAGDKAEFRSVTVGDWFGDEIFVTAGLKAGDRVAVDGIIRLAAGTPVKVVEPGATGNTGSAANAAAK